MHPQKPCHSTAEESFLATNGHQFATIDNHAIGDLHLVKNDTNAKLIAKGSADITDHAVVVEIVGDQITVIVHKAEQQTGRVSKYTPTVVSPSMAGID